MVLVAVLRVLGACTPPKSGSFKLRPFVTGGIILSQSLWCSGDVRLRIAVNGVGALADTSFGAFGHALSVPLIVSIALVLRCLWSIDSSRCVACVPCLRRNRLAGGFLFFIASGLLRLRSFPWCISCAFGCVCDRKAGAQPETTSAADFDAAYAQNGLAQDAWSSSRVKDADVTMSSRKLSFRLLSPGLCEDSAAFRPSGESHRAMIEDCARTFSFFVSGHFVWPRYQPAATRSVSNHYNPRSLCIVPR